MPVRAAEVDRERRHRIVKEVAAWTIVLGMTATFLWASAAGW